MPLDYDVSGYTKAMVQARKVNTKELVRRSLSAPRRKNNAVALRRVTCSLLTRLRNCIQTHGGHFEQLA